MNELQPVIDWLLSKWPWLAGTMATARIFAKPISGLLQSFLTKLALYVVATPETDDDVWVTKIVTNPIYRVLAFLLDWILSIKLPTEASLAVVLAAEANLNKPTITPPQLTLFLLCGYLCLGTSGCALFQGATPAKQAVNVSDVTRVTVESALRAWDDYIVAHHPPLSQQREVKKAWENYRAAQVLILDAALILKEAETAGTTTPEQQAQLNYAVAEASAALADLIKLLQGFGVKL